MVQNDPLVERLMVEEWLLEQPGFLLDIASHWGNYLQYARTHNNNHMLDIVH